MVKDKLETFRSYCKTAKNRYFPSVRGAVLLIVIPALVILPIYFLTIVKEIVIDKVRDEGATYEERYSAVWQDLPPHAHFNYITDYKGHTDFLFARYALVPGRMVRGPIPTQDFLVVQYLSTPGIPNFKGYKLLKDYGNGVMLFKRNVK